MTVGYGVFQVHWYEYPDFTPEKQLEIIKLLIETLNSENDFISFNLEKGEYCADFIETKRYILNLPRLKKGRNQDFVQALAQLTTELMKAGVLDKEKVKEILE